MGNEVRTIFTVDLTAFVDGLKTMLSMTAATGQQLKPLLSVDAKVPNYSGLETQLKSLSDRTKDYLKANQESTAATGASTAGEQQHEEKTNKASAAVGKKSESMKGMKREALESFGAVSFLVVSITQLTSRLGGGSEKMDKMSRGMSEGISAGFGLASMMTMLGVATGGVSVAIGATVAVGVALLGMFNDNEAAAKRFEMQLAAFDRSLRGATISSLEATKTGLLNTQKALKEVEKDLDSQAKKWTDWGILGQAAGYLFAKGLEDKRDKVKSALKDNIELVKGTQQKIDDLQKTTPERNKFIADAEVQIIQNKFAQQRATALLAYQREQEEWKGHSDALLAAKKKYESELRKITLDEAQSKQQLADTQFERELNGIRIAGLKKGTLQQQIDLTILETQERHYTAQLAKLNKIPGPLTPEQVQRQAQLETQLSGIIANETAARIALRKAEKQNIDDTAELEFEQVKNRLQQRLIVEGKTEEQIAAAVTAREKMRAQAELGMLNQKKTLTVQEKASKLKFETDITAIELKETQGKKAQTDARLAMVQQEIAAGMQSYDSAVSLGLQMNQLVNESIRRYIAEAVAAQIAKVIATIPFPFNIIAAPIAGLAVQALIESLIPKFAQGTPPGGFIVPPGYNDDNFLIGVSSGEKVNVQSAMRNTYLPQINNETMSAPSYLRRQEIREAAVEMIKAQIELSSQTSGSAGSGVGGGRKVEMHVHIENLIGTDDYVRSHLKPSIERLMRELGASSVDGVFVNSWKNDQVSNA